MESTIVIDKKAEKTLKKQEKNAEKEHRKTQKKQEKEAEKERLKELKKKEKELEKELRKTQKKLEKETEKTRKQNVTKKNPPIIVTPEPAPIQNVIIEPVTAAPTTIKIPKKNIKNAKDTTITSPMIVNMKESAVIQLIEQFKRDGYSALEKMTESELSNIILLTNKKYYNSEAPLMTDNDYDIIKEYIERIYPANTIIKQVGAPAPVQKNKADLPYEMPSMDKIKPDTNALVNWMREFTGQYVISCKLDGVSGLYIHENGKPKLYTRGDGKVGQDISYLLPHLQLPPIEGYAIRGEFIIPKHIFDEKYKASFANPRNLVSGIINSHSVDSKIRDLHFVAYEIISPQMKPSEQFQTLVDLRMEVVQNKTVASNMLSNELLSETLLEWRSSYEYEIDGIIVSDDKVYPRVSGNPKHSFAFKMVISDQMAEAKVVDVIWSPSKNGYLKPRVRIEPVRLSGVVIEYTTGFNAKFIEDNKIGIGALITIIRSGDVIPYIQSVIVPAETPKMPSVKYVWTPTHVDIVLENVEDDSVVREKNAAIFFETLGVDGLSIGNIKRLFNGGYDSIPKILAMKKEDFEKVEGFKSKMTDKIYSGIHKGIERAKLLDIMVASNKMGRGLGERKMKPIMDAFPDILTSGETSEKKMELLKTINGIGNENAREFVSNIPAFLAFLKECGLERFVHASSVKGEIKADVKEDIVDTSVSVDKTHPLYGKKIVMTKVRDKTIIESLPKYNATLEDSVKKDTFALVVKSKNDTSNKTESAKKYGIQIMTPKEFIEKYLV